MNFALSGFTFRRKFLWFVKLIHFHRVLYTTLAKHGEGRGNSFYYFIIERVTCNFLFDIHVYNKIIFFTVLHGKLFSQLAMQRLFRCKLREKLLRVRDRAEGGAGGGEA